jgi:hypothetical protein
MNPDEFLSLAKELDSGTLQSPATEPKIRTAISRAYYFIFLKIKLSLENFGAVFYSGRDTHIQVVNCLFQDRSMNAVAIQLNALRVKRNNADYDLSLAGYAYGSKKAETAIGEAENLSDTYDAIDKAAIIAKINNPSP